MKIAALLVGACAALFSFSARADGPALYKLDGASSSLSYKVVHKLHEVAGTSHAAQGAVAVKPGQTQVQFKVDVSSFDSGNANRDAHMKETVEAAKFPEVMLKGIVEGLTPPARFPASAKGTLKGQLTFHGQTNPISVPVDIEFPDASHAHAKADFPISLDAYKIDRPSLMFVKIDDACEIKADLNFSK